MSDKRVNASDVCMADASPFQQHYEVKTTWPLVEVINEEFFLPLRGQLRPGDQLNLCRYDSRDPNHRNVKLLEIATVRVISAGPDAKAVPLAVENPIKVIGDVPAKPALTLVKGEAGKFKLMAGETLVEEFGSQKEAAAALAKAQAA